MFMRSLAGRLAVTALLMLACLPGASAFDASKALRYPSQDFNEIDLNSFTLHSPNSKGPIDGMSVTPTQRGGPYMISEILKRRLHALDYCTLAERIDIITYAGQLDVKPCLQAAVDDAGLKGKALDVDSGFWNLKSRVKVSSMGLQLLGEGWGELPIFDGAGNQIRATKGTIINQDYLAATDPYGIYVSASNVVIRDLELRQTQPNPAPGWQPNVGPWAIYAYAAPLADAGGHRLTVDNVMLRNVYDGINTGITRGGTFTDIFGQPLHRGIRIESNVDEPHFRNIHLGWTYWSGQADVMTFEHANLVAFDFQRVDNPKLASVFTFNAYVGLRCSQRTDSYNPGNCNRMSAANLEHDNVVTGLDLQDGAVVSISNYGCYADTSVAGSTCLTNPRVAANDFYQGSHIEISGADIQGSNGSAVQFGFSPQYSLPTHQLSNVRIRSFDTANAGAPAIAAVPGVTVQKSNLLVDGTTDPARIFGGGGKLIIPANGSIATAGWTESTNGLIEQWGKAAPVSGAATVTFPRACSAPAFAITVVPQITAPANGLEVVHVDSVSATGFTTTSRYNNGSTNVPANEPFFWTAKCSQ